VTCPFPGVDPYLESPAYWRDFHTRFITHWSEWLADHVPDHYSVRIDERVRVVEDGPGRLPDVAISQRHPLPTSVPAEGTVAVLDREPVTMRVATAQQEVERYIRITHRPDSTLITALELLSPTNKTPGDGRGEYLLKRQQFLADTVHLVELDLLLEGRRLPMEGKLPEGDYYAIVSRGDRRPESDVYGWRLSEPLPRVRIPLKAPDPDVTFDLPGLFADVFRRGRYARELPYSQPPAIALPPDYAAWVRERVAARSA
jgi:hypothetical protein